MARKLSRIAQFATLIAAAILAWPAPPRALADGGVQVAPASETVQNPFTTKPTSTPAAPQPTTALPTDSGPRMFQNPFSASASSAIPSSPSRGTLSRWRKPTQLPGSASTSPLNPSTAALPSSTPSTEWDVLTPSQLEDTQTKLLAREAEPQSSRAPAPPDPIPYGPAELHQPGWLTPSPESTTDAGRAVPLPARQALPLPSFGLRQPDPFEAVETESVISDKNAAHPIRPQAPQFVEPQSQPNAARATAQQPAAPPAVAASPADCYERAQQAAETAQSAKELAQVAQLCQQGLTARPPRDLATRLCSLAAWARNRHGELQSDTGQDAEALADFNTALEFDPNCWLALHNRAVSLAQQGKGADALRDFNRVIQLSPGMAIAYRNRGELLASMGRTEEAVADYGQAISQLPQEADLYEIRGHALHRLGRYQEALADLDHAIKLAPRQADTFTHRGNVYAELGDYNRATDDFHHALELDANCADAYRSLAWLESTCPDEKFRDAQQAMAAADRAAKLSQPGNCFVLDALAAAHANAGDFEAAIHYQKLAMANSPKSFEPQFSSRLALYEQQRPYRNEVGGTVDHQVRAASLDAAPAPTAPAR
jgi:tetratricopeptide (TPR) repeat protein